MFINRYSLLVYSYHYISCAVYVQERIAKAHGSQCGFCTPGIVMSMYALLRNNTMPSEEEMEKAFEGVAINIGYGFVHLLIIVL